MIDDEFNAKVSDFGLAKLLGSNESHIATRVMGTFGYVYILNRFPLRRTGSQRKILMSISQHGFYYMNSYVAPEYANTGLLNEKSDVYSFGVLLLEAVTGRDPVDYGRPANEVQHRSPA